VLRDLTALLPDALVLRAVDVVRVGGERFVRATAADGSVGAVPANDQLTPLLGILRDLVVPTFVGRDVREIERLVDDVYAAARNYKFAGMPLWNCVGHVELACLDLLGRRVGLPLGRLALGAEGAVRRPRIPVYVTRLTRETTPEQEVAAVEAALARSGARAVKIKVGGRLLRGDPLPGRTGRLVPLLRRAVGDGVTIYADANGSYDVDEGIRVGRLLEAHGVAALEEPCPWQDYEGTRRVADALSLVVAGGEQESNRWQWAAMARTRTLDVLQPDLFYNGGFVRALRVARIAAAHGLGVAPHTPKALPAAAPLLHFASVVPNLYGVQEYRAEAPELRDGHVAVPTGPGLGPEWDRRF
jgi:L-alanine-DL-glutamate epimerase-like enolase superfamily enzyme